MLIQPKGGYIHLLNSEGEPIRKIKNGDGENVFETTDKGIGMGEKLIQIFDGKISHGIDIQVDKIGSFLDQGCGAGLFGAIASTQDSVSRIFMNDVNPNAVFLSMKMARENNFFERCSFINGPDLCNLRGINICASNLPQDPEQEFCGEGGTGLQVAATLKAGETLTPGGLIVSKSVEYAKPMVDFPGIHDVFHVVKIGEPMPCKKPNSDEASSIQYYILQKKG